MKKDKGDKRIEVWRQFRLEEGILETPPENDAI